MDPDITATPQLNFPSPAVCFTQALVLTWEGISGGQARWYAKTLTVWRGRLYISKGADDQEAVESRCGGKCCLRLLCGVPGLSTIWNCARKEPAMLFPPEVQVDMTTESGTRCQTHLCTPSPPASRQPTQDRPPRYSIAVLMGVCSMCGLFVVQVPCGDVTPVFDIGL